MATSRRRLLVIGLVGLGALAVPRAVGVVEQGVNGAIRAARPAPSGTSATRCAQCGATDHTMLDRRCPLAPRVLA
jgi:hypothetical protein